MIKRLSLIPIGILLLAQLVQPDRSVPAVDPTTDLLKMTTASSSIRDMVVGACYDRHSYQTEYPWYAYVTPVNFWLQDHIDEGREVLNYSRWDHST